VRGSRLLIKGKDSGQEGGQAIKPGISFLYVIPG